MVKLNPAGTALVYSTYLGGSGLDVAYGIAVDGSGNAYVTGNTGSTDFPTTPGAYQTTNPGITEAFVAKVNATGSVARLRHLSRRRLRSPRPWHRRGRLRQRLRDG